MGRSKAYQGDGTTVRFEARRCIHAAECVTKLPRVFNVDSRPWIDPAGGSVEDIVRVVERCPSGALTYERTDGGPAESVPEGAAMVTTTKDGPLFIRGPVEVVDHDGKTICVEPRAALCRCGHSRNKPFCDNSHIEAGFSDSP